MTTEQTTLGQWLATTTPLDDVLIDGPQGITPARILARTAAEVVVVLADQTVRLFDARTATQKDAGSAGPAVLRPTSAGLQRYTAYLSTQQGG